MNGYERVDYKILLTLKVAYMSAFEILSKKSIIDFDIVNESHLVLLA